MRMDLEAVTRRVLDELRGDERFGDVRGELTGERRANRPRIRIYATYDGEERTFLYHVQREGPIHTVARSLVDDTIGTAPQRIVQPATNRPQPNDVYYPSARGHMPTTIPGQASGPSSR